MTSRYVSKDYAGFSYFIISIETTQYVTKDSKSMSNSLDHTSVLQNKVDSILLSLSVLDVEVLQVTKAFRPSQDSE